MTRITRPFPQQIQKNKQNDITEVLYQQKIISDTAAVKIGYFCGYGRYTVQAKKLETQDSTLCVTKMFRISEQIVESDEDREIKIEVDKESYRVGDTLSATIASTYQDGSVLATVSNSKICDYKCLEISNGICKYSFIVTEEMKPVAFIIVTAFKNIKPSTKSKSFGIAPIKKQIKKIDIYSEDEKLDIDIAVSHKETTPKSYINVNVKVNRSDNRIGKESELTILVVDETMLSLREYKLQELVDVFYRNVDHSAIINDNRIKGRIYSREYKTRIAWLIKEMESDAFHGTRIRQDFRKLAYYNSSLITDNQGRAKFNFTLPDNCTTWRIMVVGVSENDLLGYGEESIVVKQPLTIRPVLPRFARYGDQFYAGFSITNGTKENLIANTAVNIFSDGVLEMLHRESTLNVLDLKKSETKIKLFPFEAKSMGTAQFTFMGTSKKNDKKDSSFSDGVSVPINIHPIPPTEKLSCAGEMVDSVSYQINVPQDIRNDLGGVEIEVSNSILTTLKEPLDYLI